MSGCVLFFLGEKGGATQSIHTVVGGVKDIVIVSSFVCFLACVLRVLMYICVNPGGRLELLN